MLRRRSISLDRAPALAGRNPQNIHSDARSPDADNAAITALAPGIGTTANPASATARTSAAPGSLTAGVPASLTIATRLPSASREMISSERWRSLCACTDMKRAPMP